MKIRANIKKAQSVLRQAADRTWLKKFRAKQTDKQPCRFIIEIEGTITVVKLREILIPYGLNKKTFIGRIKHWLFYSTKNSASTKMAQYKVESIVEETFTARESTANARIKKIINILKKLDYYNDKIIFSLPRSQATSRYLRLPTNDVSEIDNIISFQASHYLPYSIDELITGYQMIQIDNGGYANINLAIVHKLAVKQYQQIIETLNVDSAIFLSSYGICAFFHHIYPAEKNPVIVMDVSANHAEIAICKFDKLIFSRYFKLEGIKESSGSQFQDEIKKTLEAYSKEVQELLPKSIYILGDNELSRSIAQLLGNCTGMEIRTIALGKSLPLSEEVRKRYSDCIPSVLIGLGLSNLPYSLNMIPSLEKTRIRRDSALKQGVQIGAAVLMIVLIWTVATFKHIENKEKYYFVLNKKILSLKSKVMTLEMMDKKLAQLKKNSWKRVPHLEILRALHEIVPEDVYLSSIESDAGKEISLRGQAGKMDSVFTFVNEMSAERVLRDFNINVNYATHKKNLNTGRVQFEILCKKQK